MKENTIDFVNKLIEKSTEAFIMGLEIYNKPTIKYRVEGFSFFICNAWELMLKAHIIKLKGENAIYYKDSEDRTLNLENCIKIVFSDKNGSLRKNLERIIDLRNTSTHFVTEDYEYIYAPLFQACVINYVEKMKEFHNSDITNHIAQNFLTLSVNINVLTNEEIRGKYSKEMAEKLITNKNEIEFLMSNNSSNDLYIPIRHEFVQIKDKKKADFIYAIAHEAEEKAKIITKFQDPNDKYKLTRKNVIASINKQILTKNIVFNYTNSKGNSEFNEYTLNLIMKFYNLKNNEKYCFEFGITRRYSHQLIDFCIDLIINNPNIIKDLKNKITPGS